MSGKHKGSESRDVAAEAGVSYRMLMLWVARHWLQPQPSGMNLSGNGTGYAYTWPESERRAALLLARLTRAGLSAPTAAEVVASAAVGRTKHELAPGIWVTIP